MVAVSEYNDTACEGELALQPAALVVSDVSTCARDALLLSASLCSRKEAPLVQGMACRLPARLWRPGCGAGETRAEPIR